MTINAPTYPGDVLTLTADDAPAHEPDPAPAVVDDSPAALIARLTAGDARRPTDCPKCGSDDTEAHERAVRCFACGWADR